MAGLLHGLSVRVPPGEMTKVVEALMPHVMRTMRWIAENEDLYQTTDDDKEQSEEDIRRAEGTPWNPISGRTGL